MPNPSSDHAPERRPAPRQEFSARYWLESPSPLGHAAEVIAGEQSSGTFTAVPGETAALKERARARVLSVVPEADAATPSLHSARAGAGPFHRGTIEVAFPTANVGADLSTLMATVAGNLFELGEVTGLRLLDLDMPAEYARGFAGPRFGIPGTRAAAGRPAGPVVGTIIKPSIGLTPEATAALVDELCAADIDFIKDDELTASPAHAPFEARLAAAAPVLARHADRLGRMPMYAINVSGGVDQMRRRHDLVVAAGLTCVMVSVNWVGIAGVEALRAHSQVPIHGHRNGWGLLTRGPGLGLDFAAYQKLWRLAGVDQLHVNGLRNKFWEPDGSVVASAQACLAPWAGVAPLMPVFSSGQWAGQAPDTYARLGSTDLIYLAGGGIIGHPDGVAAGVRSLREGWEAAVSGVGLAEYAATHPALAAALRQFGVRG